MTRPRQNNQCRIIGGTLRRRLFQFPENQNVRPTPDRIRETLFNWLQADIKSARCLDCFTGSGSLALEAASRGASQVVAFDAANDLVQALLQHAKTFQLSQLKACCATMPQGLNTLDTMFDIVFIDPPYQTDLAEGIAQQLNALNLLAPQAKIYIESSKKRPEPRVPDTWHCLKTKFAGNIRYQLFDRKLDNK